MKFTIERGVLLKSLGHVQSVVERRNTIPILSNVQIEAKDGHIALTATDLDLTIVDAAEAKVAQPGGTTAPAHTLYEIIRKLPDGAQVEFTHNGGDGRLAVAAGKSRFTLACLPQEDFPAASTANLPVRFRLPADELKRLIDKTRFAISTEETRYYLNGIYLHVGETGGLPTLRAVSTDGHRLAHVELPLPEGAAAMPGVIVPRKAVGEIRRLLEDADGAVEISLSEAMISFSFAGLTLTSKLIDATFPDYGRVIPAGNTRLLEVDARTLAEAVDRVSTISAEKTRAVKLSLEADKLTLSVTSPDSGSATEEIAVSYTAEPMEIGFNSRYVLDILNQIEGDSARVLLADAQAPTLVRDGADDSALYVLMPMRV